MTTLTGVRTPLALNLSDVTERGRYTFVDNERMQHMKGVSGHWLENRVGHEGLEITDCPSLEKALNRLNLLELGLDDIRMCVKPINQEAHVYSFRIDTAIMTVVGLQCGWVSSFRPLTNPIQQAPPFGWGLRVHSRNFITGEYTVLTLSVSAVSNLEVAYLTQGKGWHAPLRASTSVGTSTAHLHSRLTIGPLRARPGKAGQGGAAGPDTKDFQDAAPTSPRGGAQRRPSGGAGCSVTNINDDTTLCFFWHEGLAKRGANEIGTSPQETHENVPANETNSDNITETEESIKENEEEPDQIIEKSGSDRQKERQHLAPPKRKAIKRKQRNMIT
ncbi:unnamed protein product [Arctia plantaginis]|uniref:Uncharacterized protein n=1 Tax=Arctia plantaginis TaxID=874455 RepID=A0A8S1AUX9_ARCPL|nr:unnamed protein product [Arctia plantaginis]